MSKRLVVVAGEESGDHHANLFIRELKNEHPQLIISGLGGRHMRSSGVELIQDLTQFGTTGISEVLAHFRILYKAYRDLQKHLIKHPPDLLILVDFPGFNLRLAKWVKRTLNIPIFYYISPQIWAWKAKRIHLIRDCIDHMAVILPFEKAIYEQGNVPVSFVGHPLMTQLVHNPSTTEMKKKLSLPQDKRLVALLPGSRQHEIERHMPILAQTMVKLLDHVHDLHFVIPVAGTIQTSFIQSFCNQLNPNSYSLIKEQAVNVISCSECVVVASGTASLECALQIKPMCIVYKASWLSYVAACQLLKVKYLGLCNLLQNKMIAPELLQYDCNSTELSHCVLNLLSDTPTKNRMIRELQQLKESLSTQSADCTMAQLIEKQLFGTKNIDKLM